MEKQPSLKQQLTPQDWETLIEDFQSGDPSRHSRWLSQFPQPLSLLELALLSLLRKDFPLKLQLLVFLDESSHLLIPSAQDTAPALSAIVEALRVVVQAPVDGVSVTYALKEQMMVSSTSIAVTVDGLDHATRHVEALVELMLGVINRPNHGPDRQMRAVACECLRELEMAHPCLLSEILGQIWNLCHSERTHASQSYILLLTSVIYDIVQHGTPSMVAALSMSVPLVPFNVPSYLNSPGSVRTREPTDASLREIRRVMAFLLERPQLMTPLATMEMVSMLTRIVGTLALHVSAAALLKVQFSGLLYSYDPILCHVVLIMYSRFSDAFSGDEESIIRRLTLIPKEVQQPLVFRLLSLHWLLGITSRPPDKKRLLVPLVHCFYPTLFDPLALKAAKIDVLAYIAIYLDLLGGEEKMEEEKENEKVKFLEDSLICVSAFKWLPPWSAETSVAFRILHKFLIGAVPHSRPRNDTVNSPLESVIFQIIQSMLVSLALEHRGLVLVVAAFIDRLMGCEAHRLLAERLLQTFDEHLLPKLVTDVWLSMYFPIFDRIAVNDTIPPRGLLELLMKYMISLVKLGPDTGLRAWSQGSKVLGICRKMLMHHHSSRVFLVLSRLLAFTCQFFPDLEVRDNARIYLRMVLCIPGKKMRHILDFGQHLPGVSASPHPGSFFQVPSPRVSQDHKKSLGVSSYIHLERVIPLLVKESWSLAIPNWGIESTEHGFLGGIRDGADSSSSKKPEEEAEETSERVRLPQEPLRVVDSKVAEILGILRRHFACIPDYRLMPGFKIEIPCNLRFESEPFSRVWAVDASSIDLDEVDGLPALYATVLSFSSTAKYGSIPPCRVPFLLGEPSGSDRSIVPVKIGSHEYSSFRAPVMIELEPREPMPGLIDVAIMANAANGQIISGSLQSITVGIEDMFLKATIPYDIPADDVPGYYLDLFCALWEACGTSTNIGRETFPLKGGKGVAAISGTRSVKFVEVPMHSLIDAVERYLSPFVVCVVGNALINIVKGKGVIRDVVWREDCENLSSQDVDALVPYNENNPLQLEYIHDENDSENLLDIRKRNMGSFLVLLFLPPRFHFLLQMEICDASTLVRIRTDHWPCLAYIDDYLEALFLS